MIVARSPPARWGEIGQRKHKPRVRARRRFLLYLTIRPHDAQLRGPRLMIEYMDEARRL